MNLPSVVAFCRPAFCLSRARLACPMALVPQHLLRGTSCAVHAEYIHRNDDSKSIKIRRPTYDDVQRLSEGKASSSSRGWGSRQVCHRLNQEERKAYTIATTKKFLTLKGSGYRKERKGSPLANIYRQYCDAGGTACVTVVLVSAAAGRGRRREDLVLIDMAPTRRWRVTPPPTSETDPIIDIDAEVERDIRGIVETCCAEHGWGDIIPDDDDDDHHHHRGSSAVRLMSDNELRDSVPWTVLTPIQATTSPEETLEHLSTAPIWQIPPHVVGFACPERAQAKALALAIHA